MDNFIKQHYEPFPTENIISTLFYYIDRDPSKAIYFVSVLREHLPQNVMLDILNSKPDLTSAYVQFLVNLNDRLGRPVIIQSDSLDDMTLAEWLNIQSVLQPLLVEFMLKQVSHDEAKSARIKDVLSKWTPEPMSESVSEFRLECYITEKFYSKTNWLKSPIRMVRRSIAHVLGFSYQATVFVDLCVAACYVVATVILSAFIIHTIESGGNLLPGLAILIPIFEAISHFRKVDQLSSALPDCYQLKNSNLTWQTLQSDTSKEAQLIQAFMARAYLDPNMPKDIDYNVRTPADVGFMFCLAYSRSEAEQESVQKMLHKIYSSPVDAHLAIKQSFQTETPTPEYTAKIPTWP